MFRFFKENSSIILKCFLYQIGMTVFGLVVLIASKMMNDVLFKIFGVVAIAVYIFLLYTAMWEKGYEDKVKIDSGRMEKNYFYGLFVSLWANSLNILFSVIVIFSSFFINADKVVFANGIYAVFKTILHYTNAMYLTITTIDNITPFIYLIITLPAILTSWGSYILGIKGFNHIFPERKKPQK